MSDRTAWRAMVALALAGAGVAGYLTSVHYADAAPICATGGGCETVQKSSYSEIAGVPVALVGLAGYLAILASLFAPGATARLATAAMALIGVGFSAYLTYLELFVIDAICQWCVGSAVIMAALAVLALRRVLADDAGAEPRQRSLEGMRAGAPELR